MTLNYRFLVRRKRPFPFAIFRILEKLGTVVILGSFVRFIELYAVRIGNKCAEFHEFDMKLLKC